MTKTPHAPAETSKPNYKWFSDRIRDKGLTQRKVAAAIDVDPSTLSLVLHGRRRMLASYANGLARILDAPVEDILRNCGEFVGPDDSGLARVIGTIAADETVELDWKRKDFTVEIDVDLPRTAAVLQWRTAGTVAEHFDGWLVAIGPRQTPDASAMLDRYCVVQVKDGPTVLRKVRRGYAPNRYTLVGTTSETLTDVEAEWFSPVLLIRPI